MIASHGSRPCVFPFVYQNFSYTGCTTAFTNRGPWCAINIKPGGVEEGSPGEVGVTWGWCDAAGERGRRPCIFPFTYKNLTYDACTEVEHSGPWCSFDSVHKPGGWGDC
jgi:hypothetical protein